MINLVVIIISLIFVGLGFSLNYNVFKKINEYSLKFKVFFSPQFQEKLNENYTSAVKIIGTSDIALGVMLIIWVFLFAAFPNTFKNNNISCIVIGILSIMNQIILNLKLKKIK
ncbi:hypothetical protein LL036_14815 [Clostridium sp. CF011]|uniref:hypothetical protein n=1 Tax=Clostridium sp. CF011 TaxID=2843318 RepID=UPI00227BAE97|nr:hypothetical protein [Clostridium sp. CF011]WAG69256.1 hypothetical protein LL036_14815 [Clostridium sp. CF011]